MTDLQIIGVSYQENAYDDLGPHTGIIGHDPLEARMRLNHMATKLGSLWVEVQKGEEKDGEGKVIRAFYFAYLDDLGGESVRVDFDYDGTKFIPITPSIGGLKNSDDYYPVYAEWSVDDLGAYPDYLSQIQDES